MASGLRARASEARWRGKEQRKGDQQRFPLSSSSSSKLYNFFPRAIAPFTGSIITWDNNQRLIVFSLIKIDDNLLSLQPGASGKGGLVDKQMGVMSDCQFCRTENWV